MARWPPGRRAAGRRGGAGRGGSRLIRAWPLVAYVGLVVALFVRFQDPTRPQRSLDVIATVADVRRIRWQHRVFYALLLACPLEWWWRGRPHGIAQLGGAALFLAGVIGYRRAGAALGEQLSALIAPREPARLVDHGLYARLRHPMYLAELAIAAAAPWTLAASASGALAGAFAVIVVRRIAVEEDVLRARFPEYRAYQARSYRLIPYVY